MKRVIFGLFDRLSAPYNIPMSEPAPVGIAKSFYRPELDLLRFLAFFPIFFAHLVPMEGQYYGGHHLSAFGGKVVIATAYCGLAGLNLFFVLSAFLISNLLLREREVNGTVNLRAFYIRRILRIWPLYFFAIALGFCWQFIDPSQHLGRTYIVAFLLLAGNWPFVFLGNTNSFMAPLWSVSVEEQFYLAWPLFLRRLTKRGMIIFSVGLVLVGGLGVFCLTTRGYPLPEKSTFAQLPSIAIGIVLACIPCFRLSVALRVLSLLLGAAVVFATSWAYQ